MNKKKKNKENKDVEFEIEQALSNIFDEEFNINMKQIFGVAPVELMCLLIDEQKEKSSE